MIADNRIVRLSFNADATV